jgi:hypothetical protein
MIGDLGAAGDAGLGGADRRTEATPARLGGARDPTQPRKEADASVCSALQLHAPHPAHG